MSRVNLTDNKRTSLRMQSIQWGALYFLSKYCKVAYRCILFDYNSELVCRYRVFVSGREKLNTQVRQDCDEKKSEEHAKLTQFS